MKKGIKEFAITIKGKPAWIVILVILLLFGLRFWRMQATLGTEAVESLRPWLVAHYCGFSLHDGRYKPLEELTGEEYEELNERVMAALRVDIRSIKVRGFGGSVVVRAEILVDGKIPPDGKTVRYYRMNYSHLSGWIYEQEVGPWSYWFFWT